VYHTLAQSRSTNIRQTLAYSLHEVAKILGGGMLVEEELVPVFEQMIQVVSFNVLSPVDSRLSNYKFNYHF
jgi:hypothetical protein